MWLLLACLVAGMELLVLAVLSISARRAMQQPPMPSPPAELPPISIIVAARDEAANLKHLLPLLLAQDYPGTWEVVVALDRCSDDSEAIVDTHAAGAPRLRKVRITELPTGWAGKKHALHRAIAEAHHDCLAFTDADCEPPVGWLQAMGQAFSTNAEVVLGASPYRQRPGLLNMLICHETWVTGLRYLGLARLGLPYMAVGRSWGYRKAWFAAQGGFQGIAHRMSGDDDLLLNRPGSAPRIAFAAASDAQVLSEPESTWAAWWRQKRRHGSAGTAYSLRSLAILSLLHGLHLIFYLSLVFVLCLQDAATWAALLVAIRGLLQAALMGLVPWREPNGRWFAMPLMDLFYLMYILALIPASAFTEPKWKGDHGGSL